MVEGMFHALLSRLVDTEAVGRARHSAGCDLREAASSIDEVATSEARTSRGESAYLRWRIFARIFRFLRPILRRPLPVFFVPTSCDSHRLLIDYSQRPPTPSQGSSVV